MNLSYIVLDMFDEIDSYPVDITVELEDTQAVLMFIGQAGWLKGGNGHTNSKDLIEAGESFLKMVINGSNVFPTHMWLVVPEHEVVQVLANEDLKALSFKIYKDVDDDETLIVMRIENIGAYNIRNVSTRPRNEFEF